MTADFFQYIIQHFKNGLPFVTYRKPNDYTVKAFLQNDATLHTVSDYSESGFVFAPFDDREEAVLLPLETSEVIEASSENLSVGLYQTYKPLSEAGKSEHIQLVEKGVKAIKGGAFQKVVLSRCEEKNIGKDTNPIIIFKRLLQQYPTAFVYCWFHPKVGLWLGATPETLLTLENNRFTTMALAGTQAYKGTLDVNWGEKERQEQQFVTDFIVDSLERVEGSGQVAVSKQETVRAGNLLHLKTTITSNLKPSVAEGLPKVRPETLNLKLLLKELHPTPAVCGLPKESAKQFILKNEGYDRAFYTGFLGELNLKETKPRNRNRRNVENSAYASVKTVSRLFVNLRCIQLQGNQALVYVGGGITADSVPENEWEETVNKAQVMGSVL